MEMGIECRWKMGGNISALLQKLMLSIYLKPSALLPYASKQYLCLKGMGKRLKKVSDFLQLD